GSTGGTDRAREHGTGAGPPPVTAPTPNIVGASATVGGGTVNGGGISNADPRLATLGSYGGNVQTMALLLGSPAIDAGTAAGAPGAHAPRSSPPKPGAIDPGAFAQPGFTLDRSRGHNH